VVAGWLNSPGHRANILKPEYKEIGVGVANGDGKYQMYWVQVFATPGSSPWERGLPSAQTKRPEPALMSAQVLSELCESKDIAALARAQRRDGRAPRVSSVRALRGTPSTAQSAEPRNEA